MRPKDVDLTDVEIVELWRQLGADHATYGLTPDPEWPAPANEGYKAAKHQSGGRTKRPDRFVKKWLQLRKNALRRRRAVAQNVTSDYLRQIDVDTCPITLVRLTHGAMASSDWSVDRLNNDGAYAGGNLAIVSTLANQAKGNLGFDEILERASKWPNTDRIDGLRPIEWARLAALMYGPVVYEVAEYPYVPQVVEVPNWLVRITQQEFQNVLVLIQTKDIYLNKSQQIARHIDQTFDFSPRILLRRLSGRLRDAIPQFEAPHDVWLDPVAEQMYLDLHESLGDAVLDVERRFLSRFVIRKELTSDDLRAMHFHSRGYLPTNSGE
jgi:hypothetical protein